MLYTVPAPLGIDYHFQGLQTGLYNRLKTLWGVTDANYNSFGRAQRNFAKDGYIPEYFNFSTALYVDGAGNNTRGGLFFEDSLAALSYFVVTDPIKVAGGVGMVKCQLLFFTDLSQITPGGITGSQGQRLDDVAVNDVKNYIQANGYCFTVHGDCRDADKVLERFSSAAKKDAIVRDMWPRFCFRLDLELRYNPLLNKRVG